MSERVHGRWLMPPPGRRRANRRQVCRWCGAFRTTTPLCQECLAYRDGLVRAVLPYLRDFVIPVGPHSGLIRQGWQS